MSKISGIYTIINKVDNKIYVGYSNNISKRLYTHKYLLLKNKHSNCHLQRSFNKYREDNFLFELLEECEERFLASEEHYWVTMLNTINPKYGFNIDRTRPYNSRAVSKETRLKISKGNKGLFLNRKLSKETKEKISNANKGRFTSEEKREFLSKINLGHTRGRILVLQYDLNNNFIKEYLGICVAAKENNILHTSISNNIKGLSKHAGGFIWKHKLKNNERT